LARTHHTQSEQWHMAALSGGGMVLKVRRQPRPQF